MLNIIALMGRLVKNPELRKTSNSISTCTFTIACERSYAKAGETRQADFFDIVAWRGTADFVCKYFSKGQLVAVNGSLQTRTYEDKEGKNRKVYEIIAENVNFADSKATAGGGGAYTPAAQATAQQGQQAYDFAVIEDSDDLPF